MNEGDVILTPLSQANGRAKTRPALVLRYLPPYGDLLVCGISTQLHQAVEGFDEAMLSSDPDYQCSGLMAESLIRLGFLAVIPKSRVIGAIGSVDSKRHDSKRHETLLRNLARHLVNQISE